MSRLLPIVVAVLMSPGAAWAQGAGSAAPEWRPWRPVVSVGGGWAGADALGAAAAETRTATIATSTPPAFTLFRTDSRLGAAPRLDVAVAVPVTRALALEVGGTAARPTLSTSITGDAEAGAGATASERVDEYTLGVRVTYDLARWSWRRRLSPYVAAGGAYLRQLHEANVLLETGQVWTAGAGLRWWWRGGVGRRSVGVSAETGWSWRSGGITVAGGARSAPVAALRVFAGL
ncbi:MAG: hypothetical protein AB7O28_04075 [Vicinamibacterales bacterium]